MRYFLVVATAALLVLAIGCQKAEDPRAAEKSSKGACRAIAQKFADAMIAKDWTAARAMGTKSFQETHTIEQLQAGYDQLANQIIKDVPGYQPNASQIDTGELPTSIKDAEEAYSVPKPPDPTTWRGWVFAIVGIGKPNDVEHGLEARLFVVEEDGQLKIAHVEFAFPH